MKRQKDYDKNKKIVNIIVFIYSLLPKSLLKKLLVLHRNTTGLLGYGLRYGLLKNIAKTCGDNVAIDVGVFLIHPENMEFGSNVSINPMSYLTGSGGLKIGNNVSIAHRVTIMTATHNYDNIDIPIKQQGVVFKPVTIEDDVWLGANVVIVAGRTISTGSIIGANSLVTKNVPNHEIWGGVPAKFIKKR